MGLTTEEGWQIATLVKDLIFGKGNSSVLKKSYEENLTWDNKFLSKEILTDFFLIRGIKGQTIPAEYVYQNIFFFQPKGGATLPPSSWGSATGLDYKEYGYKMCLPRLALDGYGTAVGMQLIEEIFDTSTNLFTYKAGNTHAAATAHPTIGTNITPTQAETNRQAAISYDDLIRTNEEDGIIYGLDADELTGWWAGDYVRWSDEFNYSHLQQGEGSGSSVNLGSFQHPAKLYDIENTGVNPYSTLWPDNVTIDNPFYNTKDDNVKTVNIRVFGLDYLGYQWGSGSIYAPINYAHSAAGVLINDKFQNDYFVDGTTKWDVKAVTHGDTAHSVGPLCFPVTSRIIGKILATNWKNKRQLCLFAHNIPLMGYPQGATNPISFHNPLLKRAIDPKSEPVNGTADIKIIGFKCVDTASSGVYEPTVIAEGQGNSRIKIGSGMFTFVDKTSVNEAMGNLTATEGQVGHWLEVFYASFYFYTGETLANKDLDNNGSSGSFSDKVQTPNLTPSSPDFTQCPAGILETVDTYSNALLRLDRLFTLLLPVFNNPLNNFTLRLSSAPQYTACIAYKSNPLDTTNSATFAVSSPTPADCIIQNLIQKTAIYNSALGMPGTFPLQLKFQQTDKLTLGGSSGTTASHLISIKGVGGSYSNKFTVELRKLEWSVHTSGPIASLGLFKSSEDLAGTNTTIEDSEMPTIITDTVDAGYHSTVPITSFPIPNPLASNQFIQNINTILPTDSIYTSFATSPLYNGAIMQIDLSKIAHGSLSTPLQTQNPTTYEEYFIGLKNDTVYAKGNNTKHYSNTFTSGVTYIDPKWDNYFSFAVGDDFAVTSGTYDAQQPNVGSHAPSSHVICVANAGIAGGGVVGEFTIGDSQITCVSGLPFGNTNMKIMIWATFNGLITEHYNSTQVISISSTHASTINVLPSLTTAPHGNDMVTGSSIFVTTQPPKTLSGVGSVPTHSVPNESYIYQSGYPGIKESSKSSTLKDGVFTTDLKYTFTRYNAFGTNDSQTNLEVNYYFDNITTNSMTSFDGYNTISVAPAQAINPTKHRYIVNTKSMNTNVSVELDAETEYGKALKAMYRPTPDLSSCTSIKCQWGGWGVGAFSDSTKIPSFADGVGTKYVITDVEKSLNEPTNYEVLQNWAGYYCCPRNIDFRTYTNFNQNSTYNYTSSNAQKTTYNNYRWGMHHCSSFPGATPSLPSVPSKSMSGFWLSLDGLGVIDETTGVVTANTNDMVEPFADLQIYIMIKATIGTAATEFWLDASKFFNSSVSEKHGWGCVPAAEPNKHNKRKITFGGTYTVTHIWVRIGIAKGTDLAYQSITLSDA